LAGKGRELVLYTLTAAKNEAAPLGKLHGQYLQRLPSAVARLMADGGTTPPPTPTLPTAPGNLQASALSATEVQLSWSDNSSNEDGFRVERSVAGGAFLEVQTAGTNATGARVTGLAAATAYTFRVRAANSAGFSAYSNSAAATTLTAPVTPAAPAAPTTLQAQALSGTEVQLTWTDSSSNEDGFRVERSTAGGAFLEIQTVAANATGSRVTGLTAGTAYTFRVRAANAAGLSAYSNSASATTTAPVATTVPAAPSSLAAKATSATQIQLTWRDNSGNEASFRIERIINGRWTEIASVAANSTSASVSGLIASTSYSFRVRAANSAGYSPYSNTAKSSTLRSSVTPPAAPSNFSVTYLGSGTVRFTWTDNSTNETNFRIERMIGGVYKEVLVTGANLNTVNLGGLTDGASYNFRMRASNGAGYSGYSNGDNVNMWKGRRRR
ncbi:MAG TPA: fibronectin type III domain-containing protein, partial [Thermoanaerobaculia bacterium]|nr:fibronectin type III domain-containing protein [Thermoanaerobaculia bacterium]